MTIACRGASAAKQPRTTTLRIGLSSGINSLTNPTAGVRAIVQNVTAESLARVALDGRMEPQLADKWVVADDGRSLRIHLKTGLRFSDGSPLDAAVLAATLPQAVREFSGSTLGEIASVRAVGPNAIDVTLQRPSSLFLESLEYPIRKPGSPSISTGPFFAPANSPTELRATDSYYLGRPTIDIIDIKPFPSVRSAWAELLRNNIDMLYEVGTDALDSLESSTSVSVFTFTRPYQYTISFNTAAPAVRSTVVRQALNLAVDREQIVRVALNGHGTASSGPLRSNHWALGSVRGPEFDPQRAAQMLSGKRVRFTCLLAADPFYERIALEVKRQLAAVGVDMDLKSLPPDELFATEKARKYDAVLTEIISGPTLLRLYMVWHSSGVLNLIGRGSPRVDVALDQVRTASNDAQYRQAVDEVQRAFADDPPAILLAWSERARAVSRRFAVPSPQPGRDVLGTLRLWTPRHDERLANRN
jgi:peptide/nickel transport system substrate-binding protein